MNEENKFCARLAYKCGICGKEHNDVLSRAKCEIECSKKAEEEAKQAAEAKKAAEKEARRAEVNAAIKAADEAIHKRDELIADFINDYNFIEFACSLGNEEKSDKDENDNWLEKIFHQWLF